MNGWTCVDYGFPRPNHGLGTVNWTTRVDLPGTADYASAQGVVTVSQSTTQATITVNITKLAQGIRRDVLHRAFLAVVGTIVMVHRLTIDDNDAVGMTRAIDRFSHGGDTMHSGVPLRTTHCPMVRNSAIHLSPMVLRLLTFARHSRTTVQSLANQGRIDSQWITLRTIHYSTSGLTAAQRTFRIRCQRIGLG